LLHQVKNVKVIESNLFSKRTEKCNIIIANPPYINEKEYNELSFSTKQQPKKALVAKNDGY